LVDYYHKGYPITKEIGKQCMDNFKLKKGKIEEKKEIMKDTRSSLPNAIS
jgi:hypothetical protein